MTPPPNRELNIVVDKVFQVLPIIRRDIDRKIISTLRETGADFAFHHLLIMKLLEESNEMCITEIGASMGIAKAQMTQSIDKLAALGMVTRQPSTEDRRKIKITLTPKGKRTLNQIDAAIKLKMKNNLEALTDAELKKLSAALQSVIAEFSKQNKK